MASAGMLRRVALVRTDVLEELSASFIKVTRIGETPVIVALRSSETSVPTRARRRNILEGGILRKSYIFFIM
jgi:hypothetical protein